MRFYAVLLLDFQYLTALSSIFRFCHGSLKSHKMQNNFWHAWQSICKSVHNNNLKIVH